MSVTEYLLLGYGTAVRLRLSHSRTDIQVNSTFADATLLNYCCKFKDLFSYFPGSVVSLFLTLFPNLIMDYPYITLPAFVCFDLCHGL